MKKYILFVPVVIALIFISVEDSIRGETDLTELCYACHEEPARHNAHRTGVRPSFELPSKFKPGQDGTLQCSTCHVSPTEEQQSKLIDEGVHEGTKWLVGDNTDSALCGECHVAQRDYSGENGKGYGHPVIDVAADDERAAEIIGAEGKLGTDGLVICRTCHKAHDGVNDKMTVLHEGSQICLACHPDRNPAQTGARADHPVGERPRKYAEITADFKFFEPGSTVECTTCHKPHRAPSPDSFLAMQNDNSQLCTECHVNQMRVVNDRHGEGNGCKNCHTIHDSPSSYYLWKWDEEGYGKVERELNFCVNCHDEGGAAERYRGFMSYTHPMGRIPENPAWGFDGVVSCSSCHWVHNGPKRPGGRTRYIRLYSHEGGFCVGCHQEYEKMSSTSHRLKGPQTMCRQCHRMHRPSVRTVLWSPRLSRIDSALLPERECLGCHSEGGLAEDKVPEFYSHPEEIEAMELDGSKFYLASGHRAKEGDLARIVCATCHDPHFTEKKFLRPAEMIIEYCAACHDPEGEERYRKYHTAEVRQKE